MMAKLLLNELVDTLDGTLVRTAAEASPIDAPTNPVDNAREIPPSMPALMKRTVASFGHDRPPGGAGLVYAAFCKWLSVFQFCFVCFDSIEKKVLWTATKVPTPVARGTRHPDPRVRVSRR